MAVLDYNEPMKKAKLKQNKKGEWLVWDSEASEWLVVPGANSMKDHPFKMDPRIDLTKPIYEQVLRLEELDREATKKA